jgi:hypothetical protein
VGEKRRFRVARDAGGEETGQGLRGEGRGAGGEKLENKRKKEAKHKQGSFQGKGKGEAVEKRKRPLSDGKKQCWQCEGSSTCEHSRILRM